MMHLSPDRILLHYRPTPQPIPQKDAVDIVLCDWHQY